MLRVGERISLFVHFGLHLGLHQLLGRLGQVASSNEKLEDGEAALSRCAARLHQPNGEERPGPGRQLVRVGLLELEQICCVRDTRGDALEYFHLVQALLDVLVREETKALEALSDGSAE